MNTLTVAKSHVIAGQLHHAGEIGGRSVLILLAPRLKPRTGHTRAAALQDVVQDRLAMPSLFSPKPVLIAARSSVQAEPDGFVIAGLAQGVRLRLR